jgi:ureidoglycolate lyase
MSDMGMIIRAGEISREAFAAFGDVILLEGARTFACNQGRAVRHHDLAPHVDVTDEGGRAGLSIYRSVASPLPFEVMVMERHPLGSQIFIPMTTDPQSRYLIAVAPAGDFRLEAVRAFVVRGQTGINYFKGVWHLPIVALDRPMDFLAVDRIGSGSNLDEVRIADHLHIEVDDTIL